MLPEDAVFEEQPAPGVAIYDVSHILPKHKKKKYKERAEGELIVRVYNHHTGALGKPGYEGLKNSTAYTVRDKKRKLADDTVKVKKGWAGQPYTYWYAFEPDRDGDGRIVIYRANLDVTVSYHTGRKANHHGVGIGWQGNLTDQEPSDAQIEMAEAHFPLLLVRHDLAMDDRPFSYHAEAGDFGGKAKPTCPGPHVTAFVVEYRDNIGTVTADEPETVVAAPPPGPVANTAATVRPGAPATPVAAAANAQAERLRRRAERATAEARRATPNRRRT